jgi:hypothetical protein
VNYPIAAGALCAGSLIQLLQSTGSGSYTPTFTCQLGNFVPISADEVEALAALTGDAPDRRRARGRNKGEAVSSEQVELPPPPATAPATPTE